MLEEFERRGFGQPVIFFRPTYFDVLKFHEIDSGEVGEDDVQMCERTGAEIAPDYRKIMRKLRGALASARGKSSNLCLSMGIGNLYKNFGGSTAIGGGADGSAHAAASRGGTRECRESWTC